MIKVTLCCKELLKMYENYSCAIDSLDGIEYLEVREEPFRERFLFCPFCGDTIEGINYNA